MIKQTNKLFILPATLLWLAGCSAADDNAPQGEETAADSPSATEDPAAEDNTVDTVSLQFSTVEERLQLDLANAPYSGEQYEKDAVMEHMADLTESQSAEAVYLEMLALAGEDYREFEEFISSVDTSFESASAQPGEANGQEATEQQVNIAVLFDSSGSMAADVGGIPKIQSAKEAVSSFVSGLPDSANVSLTVYGHKGTNKAADKEQSCEAIEEVYELGEFDEQQFTAALDSFSPAGWTPLASALASAQNHFDGQASGESENLIYVVSDGMETCNGNPVKQAEQLNQSGSKAIVNIIGFDVENEGQKQLKDVADAGDGTYSTVRNDQELKAFFEKETTRIINEWYQWESENLNKVYKSETERINELYDQETEFINATYDEETRFKELSYELEEAAEIDGAEVRKLISATAIDMRQFARGTATDLRKELRSGGNDHREETRDKAKEEREELRGDGD
ncbi:VWA domain-containing protein [Planococcus sp. SSTMD024]|uniref:VWA domain-containing protein n=1 Tax=Planococcus sp. SSTMD024 TaxID=3242163 RepID=UPI00351E6F16